MKFALALLLLNAALSFTSWWPTLLVQPDTRISPEFSLLIIGLSFALAAGKKPGRSLLKWIAGFYLLLIAGRYVDVIAPSLFGRPISLYWDVPQLPRFIWVTVTGSPLWVTVLSATGLAALVYGSYRLVLKGFETVTDGLLKQVRKPALWCVLAPVSLTVAANYAGVQATWPYISKPVIPTYAREVGVVIDSLIPERANRLLPPSTTIESAGSLSALKQRDVMLVFLESHGAVLYDNPTFADAVGPSLNKLQSAMQRGGRQVMSAFFTSATIGGASDLAHLSLLSGIDLSDPRRHDLLVTTNRPTLLSVFKREGYEVFGVYHSVYWDWQERRYYGFDTYLSGPDLGYRGPEFGFWKIPDQFAMARVEQLHPRTEQRKPRMMVMSTMSTHFPFVPVPPYQPDWKRVLGDAPFDDADVAKAKSATVNWTDMAPDYIKTLQYAHTWLAGWFAQPEPRETVYILVGDHQPTSNIAGENVRWDVPVYVVTSDAEMLHRLRDAGFSEGVYPAQRKSLGGLHDLTAVLLQMMR